MFCYWLSLKFRRTGGGNQVHDMEVPEDAVAKWYGSKERQYKGVFLGCKGKICSPRSRSRSHEWRLTTKYHQKQSSSSMPIVRIS
jgi:hypothetical protein